MELLKAIEQFRNAAQELALAMYEEGDSENTHYLGGVIDKLLGEDFDKSLKGKHTDEAWDYREGYRGTREIL